MSKIERTKEEWKRYWDEYQKCPVCGESRVENCRCPRADSTCPKGHKWHNCVVHGVRVMGHSDHSKPTDTCTCINPLKERNSLMEAEVTVTLTNGVTIKGEPKKVAETLIEMGQGINDGVHYLSESKGLVKIADMHPMHIKNAICKSYRDWADQLNKVEDNVAFLRCMHDGPNDKTMLALIAKLHEHTTTAAVKEKSV